MAWWNRMSPNSGRGPGAGGGWKRTGDSEWKKAREENDLLRQVSKSRGQGFRRSQPSPDRLARAAKAKAEKQARDTARSAAAMSKLNRKARAGQKKILSTGSYDRRAAAQARRNAKAAKRGTYSGGGPKSSRAGKSPLAGGGTTSRAGKSPLSGSSKSRSSRGSSTVGQRMSGGSKGRGGKGKGGSRFGKRLY